MQAIVQITQESSGQRIYLLGWANSEAQARQNAFAYCNNGHNAFDEEFQGGTLLNVAPRLQALAQSDWWEDRVTDDVFVYGATSTNPHMDLMAALGRLEINAAGELDYGPDREIDVAATMAGLND